MAASKEFRDGVEASNTVLRHLNPVLALVAAVLTQFRYHLALNGGKRMEVAEAGLAVIEPIDDQPERSAPKRLLRGKSTATRMRQLPLVQFPEEDTKHSVMKQLSRWANV
jgi:hypothetical protein